MRGDRACGLCEAVVTRDDVLAERVVLFRSALYCAKCAGPVARLRRETLLFAASFDKSESYACSRCPAPITTSELDNAKFTRWQEQLYCSPCSKDVKSVFAPAQATPAADEAVDICAHCSGLISASDVNSGLSLVVDGESYCKSCRNDHTASVAMVAKAPKNDPTLAQGTRELTMQLLPDSGEMQALAAAPSAPSPSPSVELDLVPDASTLEVFQATKDFEKPKKAARSSKKSRSDEARETRADERTHAEAKSSRSRSGERRGEQTREDKRTRAGSRSDEAKRSGEKKHKKSRKPEPVSADDLFGQSSPTAQPVAASTPDATIAVEMPVFNELKGEAKIQVEEFSLDSSPVQAALGQPIPRKGDARGSQFDSHKATVPLDAPAKSTRRKKTAEESIGKLAGDAMGTLTDSKRASSRRMPRQSGSGARGAKCAICSRTTGDSKAGFGDKPYCSLCSVELAEVLAKTKMKSGADQVCSVCESPASGEGALNFMLSNIAYCPDCAPQAEPIVESMVRDGVERRRRRARKPLIAAAAIALVAIVGGGFGFLHAEPAQAGAPAGLAKPAATEAAGESEGAEGEGPAKAVLDELEADLGHLVANSGLAESALAFEAAGARDRASDRLRVVTVVPHPNGGGKVRALMEYSVSEKKLERRMVRWLDEKGGCFEKNSPISIADHVISFRLEWTRGSVFVDPNAETASGAEFAKKAPPKAVRAILITETPDGKKQRYEREVSFAK